MLVEELTALATARKLRPQDTKTTSYRFGNGSLSFVTDYHPLIQDFHNQFSEYETDSANDADVSCEVHTTDHQDVVTVIFHRPEDLDAMGLALDLLEHPFGKPHYTEMRSTLSGWRFIQSTRSFRDPVVAASNSTAILDVSKTPPAFLMDFLLSPVLSLQKELLFLHAASLKITEAGVLLLAPSRGGKTTLSTALATRHHTILGDDVAAIRLSTREIVPFRQAAFVRSGPRAEMMDRILQEKRFETESDGRVRIPIHEVFPAHAHPVIATHAFFLRSFAEKPSVRKWNWEWKDVFLNQTLLTFWGVTPDRRLMQLLLFEKLLSKLNCWFVDAGTPDDTAALIERMCLEFGG